MEQIRKLYMNNTLQKSLLSLVRAVRFQGDRTERVREAMVCVYRDVTGTTELQNRREAVERAFEKMKALRKDAQTASESFDAAKIAWDSQRKRILQEINDFPHRGNWTSEEIKAHEHRRLDEIKSHPASKKIPSLEAEMNKKKDQHTAALDEYVDALHEKHTAELVWSRAFQVLAYFGSILSVTTMLVLTPGLTLITTSYRINKSVETSIARAKEGFVQQVADLLESQQQQAAPVTERRDAVEDAAAAVTMADVEHAIAQSLPEMTSELQAPLAHICQELEQAKQEAAVFRILAIVGVCASVGSLCVSLFMR